MCELHSNIVWVYYDLIHHPNYYMPMGNSEKVL